MEQVDAKKTYVVSGETLEKLLRAPNGVAGQIDVHKLADGTVSIGFANPTIFYGIHNGFLAAWVIPAEQRFDVPGLV